MVEIRDLQSLFEQLQPWWEQFPEDSLAVRGLLQNPRLTETTAWLEQEEQPQALALSHRPQSYTLAIQSVQAGETLLEELFQKDEARFHTAALPEPLVPFVEQRLRVEWNVPCWQMVLPWDVSDAQLQQLSGESASLDGKLTELTEDDLSLILQHWPYGEPDNEDDRDFVRRSLLSGTSSAFQYEGELCSWMLTHLDGSIGFLHTLEEFRGKGLATAVVAELSRKVRKQRGYTPFLYVVDGNSLPQSVFAAIGFQSLKEKKVWIGGEKL